MPLSLTIDAICSDHQPHEADAKINPFPLTEPGISGLETLLPLTVELVRAVQRERLIASMHSFITMYRPHAAREDTVLFPAFREVTGKDYEALGERFEQEERRRLGEHGFDQAVEQIAAIERTMGMENLAKFTP